MYYLCVSVRGADGKLYGRVVTGTLEAVVSSWLPTFVEKGQGKESETGKNSNIYHLQSSLKLMHIYIYLCVCIYKYTFVCLFCDSIRKFCFLNNFHAVN